MPTYNAGQYIEQAIDSVLQQTYSDYELIIVDDGSTDDTASRIAQYGDKIRYIYQANQERSAARNTGIRASSGHYVAFLDADDIWHREKLAYQMACASQLPEATLIFSWAQAFIGEQCLSLVLGQDFQGFGKLEVLTGLLMGNVIPTLTVLVDRCAAIDAGLFDPAVVIIEDWDFWLRLSIRGQFVVVPQVLAYYRLAGKYLPTAMKRVDVPSARVSSVERVFCEARKVLPISLPSELEAHALALAWWNGCLIEYAVGDYESGQQRLLRSINLNPEFHLRNSSSWIQSLVAFANNLYDFGTPRTEGEAFLAAFFHNLPQPASTLRSRYRAALGWLRASYAFRLREQGSIGESRALMQLAISVYPPMLRNLGIISTALHETVIDPKRAIHWLEKYRLGSIGSAIRR